MLNNFTIPATAITEEQIAANKEQFISLIRTINRPGIDRLIAFLEQSDFFVAPASTKYHSCFKGGLCQHSLNVLYCLEPKLSQMESTFQGTFPAYPRESVILTALLHDVSKAYYYEPTTKSQKVYNDYGSKAELGFKFDWQTTVGYTVIEPQCLPHAERSTNIVDKYVQLSKAEYLAIRWHMGFSEPEALHNYVRNAFKLHPLVIALHEADMEATYIIETDGTQ